jgi:predicted CXXCH cytochrome family protein
VNDQSGFVGDDLALYPHAGRYGLSLYVLYRDGSGRVVGFREQQVYMTEKIADDPKTRRAIDDFYLSKPAVSSTASLAASGYWTDTVERGARFVGAPACRECHDQEYEQWIGTGHGSAFKTLLGQHRQYNPACVSCHVTGFEQESGYAFGDMRSPMMHVQCEACHGPGAAHVAAEGAGAILRAPTGELCRSCHAADHSDMTDENFAHYYAKVAH